MQKKDRGIQLQEYRGKKRNGYKKRTCIGGLPAGPETFKIKTERFRRYTRGSAKNLPQMHTKTSGKM